MAPPLLPPDDDAAAGAGAMSDASAAAADTAPYGFAATSRFATAPATKDCRSVLLFASAEERGGRSVICILVAPTAPLAVVTNTSSDTFATSFRLRGTIVVLTVNTFTPAGTRVAPGHDAGTRSASIWAVEAAGASIATRGSMNA